jgi:hypothetical protein
MVDLSRQMLPVTFEHALAHGIDHELDPSHFDAHYHNDERGSAAYPPPTLLAVEVVLPCQQHREADAIREDRPEALHVRQSRWLDSRSSSNQCFLQRQRSAYSAGVGLRPKRTGKHRLPTDRFTRRLSIAELLAHCEPLMTFGAQGSRRDFAYYGEAHSLPEGQRADVIFQHGELNGSEGLTANGTFKSSVRIRANASATSRWNHK